MEIAYRAFTLEADGRLDAIRTPVTIVCDGRQEAGIAVWDTGANRTYVSKKIISALGIEPIGTASYNTASDEVISGVYLVDVLLPNNIAIKDVSVFSFAGAPNCDVLIGMDIICSGDLAVTNALGQTWASFRVPAARQHIDFKNE